MIVVDRRSRSMTRKINDRERFLGWRCKERFSVENPRSPLSGFEVERSISTQDDINNSNSSRTVNMHGGRNFSKSWNGLKGKNI